MCGQGFSAASSDHCRVSDGILRQLRLQGHVKHWLIGGSEHPNAVRAAGDKNRPMIVGFGKYEDLLWAAPGS